MTGIAILTDSTANLPLEWIEQYNIHVIPLKIHWEDSTYLDGVDMKPNEFYPQLSKSRTIPTTSQPALQDFLDAYEHLAEVSSGIAVILISSGISGTVVSAQSAACQFSRVPVEVIDTRATSVAQALIVLAAAQAAAQGKSLQEVCRTANAVAEDIHVFFAVDTLKYLHQGGRIGGASRFLGTALDLKPILYFTPDGKLNALERVRTKKGALERLVALVEENANGQPLHIGVVHAGAPEMAQTVYEEITRRFKCEEAFVSELSPVIGVHVGPGLIGVSF
jgi:DegV family protein with EDD domain